jgi:hypothetical protein
MITSRRIQNILKQHKQELRQRFKLKEIGIFGSYLRGEQNKRSDVDILVDFERVPGLLEVVAMERYLSKLIGKKVDLVMKTALKPRIGKHILKEVIYI